MKTLIVEDDMMSQCLLAKVLAERGHEVVSYDNAEQAILAYQKEFYPLLFVDVDLPGMDGLQFCKWVRAQPKGDQVFIIMATSAGRPEDLGEVLLVGANDFLPKPYEAGSLSVRLTVAEGQMNSFFERKSLETELADTRQQLETQVRDLSAELATAREAALADAAEYQKLEHSLQEVRSDLETQLRQESAERAKLAEDLKSEGATRRKLEGELARTRDELSGRVKEFTAELGQAKEALNAEVARRKEGEDALSRQRREAEAELQAQADELARAARGLKAEQAIHKELDEALKKVQAELLQVREDLARRVLEHTAELVRAGDELKAQVAGRKQAEENFAREREGLESKAGERARELALAHEQLNAAIAERQRLEQDLARTRAELEARLQDGTVELARINEELNQRQEWLAKRSEELEAEAAARRRAEEALQRSRAELETRVTELTGQLEQAREALNERSAQVARGREELEARSSVLARAGEELKTEIAARQRAEMRNAVFLKVARELNSAHTLSHAARVLAAGAQELIRWDACSFDLYSPEENTIEPLLSMDTVNGRPAEVPPTYAGPDPSPLMRRVIKEGPQLVLRSAPSHSHTDYILFGDRARLSASLMYVAVRAGDRIVGFLSVHSYAPGAYNDEDLQGLQTLADHGGGALERIRAEENRRQIEERFQLVTRAVSDVVWDWELASNRMNWSETFRSRFGVPGEETAPGFEAWAGRIHPEEKDRVLSGIQSTLDSDAASWSQEYRFRRQDGSYADVVHRGSVIRNTAGKPLRMVGAMTEVTAKNLIESAVTGGGGRAAAILEAAPDAVVTIDDAGKVLDWNCGAEKMFGHRRADVSGKDLADLVIPAAMRERHRAGLSRLREGGQSGMVGRRVELQALRADGSEFPAEMTITRLEAGDPPVYIGFIRDLTERVEREGHRRHARKMESVGQLSANVAHDFNNLLGVVQGYSTLLMEEKDLKQDAADALKQIASATDRASQLTRQLLAFSRKQVVRLQTLDLNELLNNAGQRLRLAVGETIGLQFGFSPALPAVEADTGMIEEVVLTLASNARDAMPQGGQLTIATKAINVDEACIRRSGEARPGRFVCLTVTDTGCGMDEVALDHLFEPFFTTKPSGKGSGLGLAAVYGIVKQHLGWIEVQSRPGQGSTFNIFLPASSKSLAPKASLEGKPALRGGSETILLVEDEPAVLTLARGILQRLGYQVFPAPSGDDAAAVWQEHREKVDLLLTDMVLPGNLNGQALAEQLRREKPGLKVLYTSGYSIDVVAPGLSARRDFVFLQKPYHPEALAQTVRICLDGALP